MAAPHESPESSIGIAGINRYEAAERSPLIKGLFAALKGAAVGAPLGSFVYALANRNPIVGATIGALGAGAAIGLGRAIKQDVDNRGQEADIRYYSERLKEREPFFFMPPPSELGRVFSGMHDREHALFKKIREGKIKRDSNVYPEY